MDIVDTIAGVSDTFPVAGAAQERCANILESLDRHARLHGAQTAYRFVSGPGADLGLAAASSWSWQEVHDRARAACAEILRDGDIQPGDRVLLTYPAGLDFIAALLGCFLAGVIAVPVSAPRRNDRQRWAGIYRDSGASASFVALGIHEQVAGLSGAEGFGPCRVLCAASPAQSVPAALPAIKAEAAAQITPEDIAFLQYTSGSTGAPKGVIVTHGMLQTNLMQIVEAFGYRDGDHLLSWLPMYHDMGLISSVLLPVHMKMDTTLTSPTAFLRDPMWFLQLAGRVGATALGGPNFAYDHCLRKATPEALARIDLSALRVAFSGAEAIRAQTVAQFAGRFAGCGLSGAALAGCYGMAEATVCVSVSPPDAPVRRSVLSDGREMVESGVVPAGMELAIVDPATCLPLPDGQTGEIWIRGGNVSPGYWNRPDATAETFGHRLHERGGWMRSGDLGALRDGRLYVTGRIKEMIVLRGVNHYPEDLEATVAAAHPQIQPGRVAAFALEEGEGDGALGLACELTRAGLRAPDSDAIFAAIRARLSEAHDIAASRILLLRPASLPITPSGKIQRRACREDMPGLVAHWHRPPAQVLPAGGSRGDLARRLRAMPAPIRRGRLLAHLRDQLAAGGVSGGEIDETTRFFDLGLDSVNGVELVGALEQALDVRLEATVIYEHSTPGALCDHLIALLDDTPAPAPVPEALQDDIAALKALLAPPTHS